MKTWVVLLAMSVSSLAVAETKPTLRADPPKVCDACDEWNGARAPFRLFGNTYYVGVAGLSSVLVTSDKGHVLLDGALPQSAPLIDANIRALGFRTEDVRIIVNSHAHFDHAGGIAALQRASGAEVAASGPGAAALGRGGATPDDPQYGFGTSSNEFPKVGRVRVVADGEVLRVGPLAITAHLTPGHTPGSTTWSWRSCEGERCLEVVYADSLNAVSSPGFRFTGDAKHPGIEASFRRSIAKVQALPCDVVIAVHPSFTRLEEKYRQREQHPGTNPFIDPRGCETYAVASRKRLDQRISEEKAAPAP
jgi:metallo-beta-lactamase class B